MVDLECEMDEIEISAKYMEESEAKQIKLDREHKLVKIYEARLKNENITLLKYQEFVDEVVSSLEKFSSERGVENI